MATNEEDLTSETPGTDEEGSTGGEETSATEDTGDVGQETQQETTPAERPSRKDRRAARLDVEKAAKEAAEWRQRFEETNGRYSDLERQMAVMAARLEEREKLTQKDTFETQIESLEEESQRHLQNVANSKDPAYQRAEMKQYHAKQRQIGRLEDKREAETTARSAPPQADPREAVQRATYAAALDSEYPDLRGNKQFQMRADEHYHVLVTKKGMDPRSIATLRASVALAARDLGINGASARPSAGNKARYLGVGTGEGDGGGDSDEPQVSFTGSDAEYRLARQMYPQLDEPEAYRKWKGDMISEMRRGAH